MNEQFVTYEIAKKLKELGFNEPCFARYASKDIEHRIIFCDKHDNNPMVGEFSTLIQAPLWQQAIDFINKRFDKIIGYDSDKKFLEARVLHQLKEINRTK